MEEPNDKVFDPIYDDSNRSKRVLHDNDANLVIQNNLFAFIGDLGKKWLHTSLFHSTCTIKNNICNLIIDNGSYKNIMSTEVVEKLQLKIDKHSKPYKLKWMKQYSKVIMDENYLVLFIFL